MNIESHLTGLLWCAVLIYFLFNSFNHQVTICLRPPFPLDSGYVPVCSYTLIWVFNLCFQGALKALSCVFKGPYKLCFLREQCFTCRVASSPCHSLPISLLSSLLPVLPRARTHTWKLKDESNWLSPGSRRPKAMQSNKDHAVYSDFFRSTLARPKCKAGGYHAVCTQYVALSCCLSAKNGSSSSRMEVLVHFRREMPPDYMEIQIL